MHAQRLTYIYQIWHAHQPREAKIWGSTAQPNLHQMDLRRVKGLTEVECSTFRPIILRNFAALQTE